ncbi:hypothetical protein [Streptomyces sp. H27-S2]|uniref:hypothetical protein n=1 Tax=Streptomyces antarcticus TaxID=2996458 RepID=UPI00226ED9EE|nr:hypothetical protein [Streptomyces sp. H27-S2]MCY0951260.1 hypothetical protein [Streptomyces sp. H27-S2]
MKRVQDVEAAYILPGNPDEEDPADRRDSVVIKYTSGDAGQRCTAMRALAGSEHGVIAYTPSGMAMDSNDCLNVKLGARRGSAAIAAVRQRRTAALGPDSAAANPIHEARLERSHDHQVETNRSRFRMWGRYYGTR